MSSEPERSPRSEPSTPDAAKPGAASRAPMDESHWSRARRDSNPEALEYYRSRSRAPGVAEGGAARNFYCMRCDGVIPFDPPTDACPHCGERIDENVKRYFNWVEIAEPPASDFIPLLKVAALGVAVIAVVVLLVWRWLA